MSDDLVTASPSYALGMLERALKLALGNDDPGLRQRAAARVEQWRAVIEGMASGELTVGSRTPVADTPAWVTLEVVHGGFATGRYLAEGELLEHEQALLALVAAESSSRPGNRAEVPGQTPRERINFWYLGDAGQRELDDALRVNRYQIEIPEEGALPVVVSLLARGHELEALELITQLRPLMHRLRFYPKLVARPRPTGACVRLATISEVAHSLRQTKLQVHVAAMNEALRVWTPLFDRLVALWLDTVEGELPRLERDDSGKLLRKPDGQPIIIGGWPCRRFPADWATRREAWLADYREAARTYKRCGKHRQAKSNFSRLRLALERCPFDSAALDGRAVGSVRLALANSLGRHGELGSDRRAQLRRTQAEVAARPAFGLVARVVADRVATYPAEGGLPSLDGLDVEVREGEHPEVSAGTPIPAHMLAKAERALEAPIEQLIERGIIGSGEVLASVLPQITAQVVAAGIDDPVLRDLFAQIYAAFRRRRSLLLLNLEHQVQLDELPWVAALAPFRRSDLGTRAAARQTLEQVALLTLAAFPQTLTPNPLVKEMQALAQRAELSLPLVEEVAADIFMGTFTTKWVAAARQAASLLDGTLYARYYDLPRPGDERLESTGERWGKRTADAFAKLCTEQAREAGHTANSWSVAANGTVLEQSQILTTHILVALIDGLGVLDRL
ncbi:MAG TPA: hypothetical protein VK034_25070, partial [Enhygromyxa sp.]|nr:hypothetical protein [Enhygromyxa sp.]